MEEYEDLDMVNTENTSNTNEAEGVDVDDMKKRLKEMEDEAVALREMQAKVESQMGSAQDPARLLVQLHHRQIERKWILDQCLLAMSGFILQVF